MRFKKLPSNSHNLLNKIVCSDNPTMLLGEMFDRATAKEDELLRGILRELNEEGFISTIWASDRPYHVTIHNKARTYEEQLAEYETDRLQARSGNITIGNKNKINCSTIASTVHINCKNENKKKSFYDNHPIFCGVLIALIAGILLLFSFWQQIIDFLEGLF